MLNGKYYVGKHSTNNLNDGYIGSGDRLRKSVKKYGKENLQNMIQDETERHQFMMDVKNLVNSILENELA